jgi:5-aminolevulinate synthase
LKQSAVNNEAAVSSYNLPEAMKQCPYVKDLYSGFGTGAENETTPGESNMNKLGVFAGNQTEPKLFKMEKNPPVCPCRDMHASQEQAGCHTAGCANAPKSDISMYDKKFDGAIDQLKQEGRYRKFINVERHMGSFPNATRRENSKKSEVVVWCSNDYLGMGQHPKVLNAMHDAIDTSGAGSGGTRNIGGNTKYIEELESEVAELHNKQRGLVCSSCYVANETALSTLPEILGPDTIYFSDSKNHASLIHGIRNGRCAKKIWKHNDTEHLEQLLEEADPNAPKVIVFESVYSMCGTVGPIKEVVELAEKYNALIFLDEVHAVGLYGPTGAGVAELLGIESDRMIISGTIGKGFGVFGGYIAGNANIIDAIRSNAPGFIFTTSLPPAVLAGAKASINHLRNSTLERNKHK